MKDYRVEVKIKNNYLLTKMMENGVASVAQLAKLTNSSPACVGDIANLKVSAYNKIGQMRPTVSRICEFLACCPDDIFPVQHLMTPLHSNRAVVEADQEELVPGYLLEGTVDPLAQLAEEDGARHVHKLMTLTRLTTRETRILTAIFGLDGDTPKTNAVLAEEFGVGRWRIQQITNKALRRMRHCATKTDWHEGTDGALHDELSAEALDLRKRFARDQLRVREKRLHDELQRRSRELPYAKDRAQLIAEFTHEMNKANADNDALGTKIYAQAIQRLKDKDKEELEALYWSLVDRIRQTPDADMNSLYDELSRIRDLRKKQGCNEHADQYQRALDLLVVVEVDETAEEVSND
jgi:DNA-directed RNA polymerase specialized sigma subunit